MASTRKNTVYFKQQNSSTDLSYAHHTIFKIKMFFSKQTKDNSHYFQQLFYFSYSTHHMHITSNMEPTERSNSLQIMQTQQISILVGCFYPMYVNK